MARHIYLTDNPGSGPEMIEPSNDNSILYFKSMGWNPGDPAPQFKVEFESAFDGKWNTTGSDSDDPMGTSGKAGRTWESKPYGSKYQRVKIKLKSSVTHPPAGYKYTVITVSGSLDPRVVPR